jgi:hypothetical protein
MQLKDVRSRPNDSRGMMFAFMKSHQKASSANRSHLAAEIKGFEK